MIALNRAVFEWINQWPDALAPFLRFFSIATNFLAFKIFLAVLVIVMVAAGGKWRRAAVQSLIAFPIANFLTDLWKHGLPENRPCIDLVGTRLHGIGCSDSFGTASAHSANMAAVAFVMTYHLKGWGSPWIVVAILTGFSRSYVGAHYPYQVLLGWLCGVVAAWVVTKTWDEIVRRRVGVTSGGKIQDGVESP